MSQSLANIHPDAKIGKNVKIEPFSTVYGNVEIGDGTWIGPNVTIFEGARIGRHCQIFPGAVISAVPQDLKFAGEETTVEIGNNTIIRECATIHRGTIDRYTTKVGDNCLLMAYSHVAHDCTVGNHVILANNVNLAGHIDVDDYAILGGLVAIQQFVHIGAHSFISGGSLVGKNVPPFVKGGRNPLSYIGVNTVGLKRRNYSDKKIAEIEDIYRTLYVRGLNVTNALNIIEKEAPESDEKDMIINFIRASKDGIMRGYS